MNGGADLQLGSTSATANIDFNTEADYIQEDAATGTDFNSGSVGLYETVGEGNDLNTKLLVHAGGTNGSTTFIDSSSSSKTVIAYGNVQVSTSQSKFGGSSLYLDGNGDNIQVQDSADWDFGTGDFTIEGWYNFTSTSAFTMLWEQRVGDSYNQLYLNGGTLVLVSSYSTSNYRLQWSGSWSPSLNTWYHVAVVGYGGTAKVYINGTQLGSPASISGAGLPEVDAPFAIGGRSDGNQLSMNGYVDEFRISKGIARWTSNFSVPTSSYGASSYQTSQPYYVTTSNLSNFNLSSVSKINSLNITNTQPTNTSIKGLISTDGRTTWKKWNPALTPTTLDPINKGASVTLSNGNKTATMSNWEAARTVAPGLTTGKYYWEVVKGAGTFAMVGINSEEGYSSNTYPGNNLWSYALGHGGTLYYRNEGSSSTITSYASSYTTGSVVGVALDLDNGTIQFSVNGVWQVTPYTITIGKNYFPSIAGYNASAMTVRFNPAELQYTAPAGFTAGFGTANQNPGFQIQSGGLTNLSIGNTLAELQSALTNYPITTEQSLDFAFQLGTTDSTVTPSLDNIQINYNTLPQGTLISSVYNTQTSGAKLSSLAWTESLPTNTDIKFQLRTAATAE